jgi:hypothetical protein
MFEKILFRLEYFFGDLIVAFTRLFGVELLLALDAPSCGCFDFQRRVHSQGIQEYFGLGLHLTVVPCELSHMRANERSPNIPGR